MDNRYDLLRAAEVTKKGGEKTLLFNPLQRVQLQTHPSELGLKRRIGAILNDMWLQTHPSELGLKQSAVILTALLKVADPSQRAGLETLS